LRDCFERNVRYLIRCFAAPFYSDAGDNNWVQSLPASAEGRLLAGAGHTLRWGEHPEMRQIVDTIVPAVKKRQTDDGYCLPYDVGFMGQQPVGFMDERRNYDRVGLTRGLIAAGMAGNADAYAILRRFYDWLYASPYALKLIAGSGYHMSAHNCNNGHEGSLLMHFSPVGTDGDLIAAERAFVQDFFIEQARNAEPLSLTYYPLHTPHSYVLLAFEAWVDHYRATGASKYLEAARGAWQFVTNSFEHVGGTIAICEMGPGSYPPGSYHLRKHTGETCGSVFWADFNHRLLQLYPDDERYAAAIERAIYNVILAAQGDDGSIRYHNHLHLAKEDPTCSNTCCEVMGVPFIARLPQYIYSIADDGLYVNLYVPSSIAWEHDGQSISVELATGFPHTQEVSLTVSTTTAVHLAVRLRVPGWASDTVPVQINGELAGEGAPGSYLSLEREWVDGDRISFGLPSSFRLSRYNGLDQISGTARYALELGPLLMALAGPQDKHYRQPDASPCASLSLSSEELIPALEPVLGQPLHFRIRGHAEHVYMPYYDVSSETFTCFPVLGA
jgi:DUF1680 family protein